MAAQYYRYLSNPAEVTRIVQERRIESFNSHGTWFSSHHYATGADAERWLALPFAPTHRVGPTPDILMPVFSVGPRTVAPAFGQPGGGVEVLTSIPVHLFGLWNFTLNTWDL